WAGDKEKKAADEIVAGARGHAVLAPRTSLLELAALARRSALFLGSDTGPLHLAAAVGATCVGLFGTSRREQSGPYGEQHISLHAYYHTGTSRLRRSAANDAMQAITVDAVCEACDTILKRGKLSRAA